LKEAQSDEFKEYARQVISNAKALASSLADKGFSIVSGGTDNHMFLVDTIKSIGKSGKEVSDILESVNITLNKNAIPFDERKPWDPSGVRIGSAAITTRGMKEKEMIQISEYIYEALSDSSQENLKRIKEEVREFALQFDIPGI
jgi:glycine hydroxymethyltransferase